MFEMMWNQSKKSGIKAKIAPLAYNYIVNSKTRLIHMEKMIKSVDVIIVRIYILESSNLIKKIFDHLEKTVKIRGISLFRGLKGFGETGEHSSSVFDVRWDLPIIIEFFDSEEKVKIALEYLNTFIKAEHIVFWKAQTNTEL
ncbi:hypothetical protein Lfee_0737 [Legionella feeleii]|uniref:Uncharacterized ACR, COG1993 n=3 Tax=Legionella feeleii TaxID=453 RepID=A0A0W0U4R0_9GAMM|nr:DUF190 domain-containing protein [Legionella feeleii]KTD02710.1 hypothetical protein Lfee_0737 [Legionella feeleii]SPX59731.1 Uncharacterized ACR, COG1993 [Legionella feeleii]